MACIGDASRFRLVQALLGGARCVTDLAGEVGLSQSCTTRHLQALERRRVVCGARDGKRVMYRLCHDEPALGPLLDWALSPDGVRAGAPAAASRRRARPKRKPPTSPVASAQPNASRAPDRDRAVAVPAEGVPEVARGTDDDEQPTPKERPTSRPSRHELEDYLL